MSVPLVINPPYIKSTPSRGAFVRYGIILGNSITPSSKNISWDSSVGSLLHDLEKSNGSDEIGMKTILSDTTLIGVHTILIEQQN